MADERITLSEHLLAAIGHHQRVPILIGRAAEVALAEDFYRR